MNITKKLAKVILNENRGYSDIYVRDIAKVNIKKLAKMLPKGTKLTVYIKTRRGQESFADLVIIKNNRVKITDSQYLKNQKCSLKKVVKLMIKTV